MLHGQKIIFVYTVDNNNQSTQDLGMTVWSYHKHIAALLRGRNCIMGRKTFEISQWKGPNSWVLTRNKKWQRSNIGTIHNLDDMHLHIDGPVYILGGKSLHQQLKDYVDEIHLYILNNTKGVDPWIEVNMNDWKPLKYKNMTVWSYVHLEKMNNYDPHGLNDEYLLP